MALKEIIFYYNFNPIESDSWMCGKFGRVSIDGGSDCEKGWIDHKSVPHAL